MAKLTYLQLTNRVLKRISQAEISDVATATGQAKIITEAINEAQNDLFIQENWYSLLKIRTFATVVKTASTIAFNNANPDTITDSGSGFGSFSSGAQIMVSGSTSNDGVYHVSTASAGTLTLQSADSLTAEIAGDSVTVTQISYPLASDFGRSFSLEDASNSRHLEESYLRVFAEIDPKTTTTGSPTHFACLGSAYRFYPCPSAAVNIRELYWAVPTALSANSSTSDLPLECENLIIMAALAAITNYLKNFEAADRYKAVFDGQLKIAQQSNRKVLNRMDVMQNKRSYGLAAGSIQNYGYPMRRY